LITSSIAPAQSRHIAINALHMAWGVNAGTSTYLSNIVKPWYESAAPGLRFTLLCQAPPEWWQGERSHFAMQIYKRASNLGWRVLYEQVLFPLIQYKNFDLVFHPGYVGCLFGTVPQVVTIHDAFAWVRPKEVGRSKVLYWKTLIPRSARRACRIIADTQVTANDVARFCEIPMNKIRVVHLAGGHLSQITPDFTVLERLGIAESQYFHCVGIFKDLKNPWIIMKAYERYRALACSTRPKNLVMVGHIGGKNGVEVAAAARGRPGIIIGARISDNELAALYMRSAGLVFASLYEGFGLPILEAQRLRCPVITSNLSCMPEVAGTGAIFVDPNNEEAISDAMLALQTGKPADLIAAAERNAASFSWEKASAMTRDMLLDALQQREA
jgi:glycosyltransferase involved in cell wall biosynthesis